jgi:hypothetical protein
MINTDNRHANKRTVNKRDGKINKKNVNGRSVRRIQERKNGNRASSRAKTRQEYIALAVPEVKTLRDTTERSGSELLVLGDSCAGLEIYNYLI